MQYLQPGFFFGRESMKRGRNPRAFNAHEVDKELDELKKHGKLYLGPSMADLPRPLSLCILLRLPTKRLLVCRCVCKTWRNIISDPQFAKLHFSKAEAFPLVRSLSPTHISRNLYLVEPPEHSSGFDLRDCCDCYGYSSSECHFHMKLETKLKIPLRNEELAMNSEGDVNVSGNSKGGVKRKRCIKLRPKDHKLNLVNSCNGFLCLSEPSRNDPVVVCNPITGEFINLPVLTSADESFSRKFWDCGLGFSPKTNQYKVIRMFDQQEQVNERIRDPITGRESFSPRVAEIHTLGTESWKRIGCAPSSTYGYKLEFPSYLNGALHWLVMDYNSSEYITSFNFDKEIFQPIPPPPLERGMIGWEWETMKDIALGALKDRLCICHHDYVSFEIEVWVMKKYGVRKSWKNVFRIDTTTKESRWLHGVYEPISYLRNGSILFFHRFANAVVYYNAKGRFSSLKFLKIRGVKSKYEAIAYTPSFISLNNAVIGDNLATLNVASRCAGMKLQGETKALFLREEDEDWDSDFD
ncbi:F-box/kelch-repeat protein At3g06240-like isoform X2 [Rhododendron vialii]|uniref:F-box/kelch-repeat protein At3g06240-like isoform X2 n=2 Tax=Rhododendron vialii TaxID=182163 RepID=UPI00265F8D29|nr:F-box/kelch-repeat protein At3g06240-like isoform X2 [Rhododendron vialii]